MSDRSWPAAPAPGDVGLILLALLATAVLTFTGADGQGAQRVVIDVEGVTRYDVSLDSQWTVTVDGLLGPSVVRVVGGRVRIESAPCPGQICVARGWLRAVGDLAVCVPNHVVVHLTGDAPPRFDGITQ